MAAPLQPPPSPSARQLRQQSSPTSPSYSEHQFKRNLLDDVRTWSETKVAEWLSTQSLGYFSQKFIDQDITGSVLLDLDYEALKAMKIKTVGERVRIAAAIKALRQECYLAASLAARSSTKSPSNALEPPTNRQGLLLSAAAAAAVAADQRHEGYNITEASKLKSSPSEATMNGPKSILNRSNSFSRFLGRADSKKSQRSGGGISSSSSNNINISNNTMAGGSATNLQLSVSHSASQTTPDLHSTIPSSPRIAQKRNSLEGGIMSMEKVKQTCVKVFGEDGQTRIVNVHTASNSKEIMKKVLHKFGIDESSSDSYCIFVGSSTNGEARALTDQELVEICKSADRPEKERLILRKRHMYPTHEEFKRKGTINVTRRQQLDDNLNDYHPKPSPYNGWNHSSQLNTPATNNLLLPHQRSDHYRSHRVSQAGSFRSIQTNATGSNNSSGRRRFFGERPPSEVISLNLPSFFPNHNREVLETAGVKAQRLSMTRRNSSLSRLDPKNYRNSVLPELVSVLGVDLDKFLEEEEDTSTHYDEDDEDDDDDLSASQFSSIGSVHSSHDSASDHEDVADSTRTSKKNAKAELPPSDDEDDKNDDSSHYVTPTTSTTFSTAYTSHIHEQKRSQSTTPSSEQQRTFKFPASSSTLTERSASAAATYEDYPATAAAIASFREQGGASTPSSTIRPKQAPSSWMKGSLIGRGTFGDVYLGLNPINGELMAVKQVELPIENSATAKQKTSMVQALRREIELLKELEHENIVQYLGFQADDAHFSIFLEYVPGGSVAGLLSSYGAFQEPLVRSFVRQILKGLNYLHSKDIVHRDIKGANVLVDNKGGVKITDFGISKKVEEDVMQGQSTPAAHRPSLQGSVFWMAPEVVKQTHYTLKADIWSLGCMVVEMFTGDHPFHGCSQMQAIFQIGCYTAPAIPVDLSEDAQEFLKCTFQLKHEERPTAEELLNHTFLVEAPVTEDFYDTASFSSDN